ncbi:MAG: UbiD family decarboxylase [Chitinophagaceae bacterium]|nr:UbiD family decarboxylase [Chitinophagaceae bacterium]
MELVQCITQPEIEVPADADFVIEGYVDPADELIWEGPFGDHTGYYSLPDWYPRFHITAITHKKESGLSSNHCWYSAAGGRMAGKSHRTYFPRANQNDDGA